MAQPTTLRERAVQDRGQIQPALLGGDVADVGEPGPVGRARVKQPPHQVRCRGGRGVGAGEPAAAAPVAADQAVVAHRPGDPLAAAADAMVLAQLSMDSWGAIGSARVVVDPADALQQLPVRSRVDRPRSCQA